MRILWFDPSRDGEGTSEQRDDGPEGARACGPSNPSFSAKQKGPANVRGFFVFAGGFEPSISIDPGSTTPR